jgi:hypothetical protein
MLAGWIRKVLGGASAHDKEVSAILDRVVASTDPRLSLLPGYRRTLTPGVRIALEYVADLSSELPELLDLSLLSFTLDRRLGLFFSSPMSLLALLRRSEPLHSFFLSATNGDMAYALLIMQRTDSQRYGLSNEQGALRADVAQTVVSFDHHRVVLPCASIDALQEQVRQRGIDVLARVIAVRLEHLNHERLDLEGELLRIRLRLSALEHPESLVIDAIQGDESLPTDKSELVARQAALQHRLDEVRGMTELSGLLEMVAHILEHPSDYFRVEQDVVNLDRMGILQLDPTHEGVTRLCMEELLLGHDTVQRRVVIPVRVSRLAMSELERCVDHAG